MLDLFGNEIKEKPNGSPKIFTCLAASNHSIGDRQTEDYYATDPKAVQELLAVESFSDTILEPCVGGGHIASVLVANGYKVIAQDIIDRGYPETIIRDFLTQVVNYNDIISNPPYVMAREFCEHALDISANGVKVAMFLNLTFLESQEGKAFFQKYPIKYLYVFSKRMNCAKNGEFEKYQSNAVAYGWFVWQKGYKSEPIIRWI